MNLTGNYPNCPGDEDEDGDGDQNFNVLHFDLRHLRHGDDHRLGRRHQLQTTASVLDRRPRLHRPGRGNRRPAHPILQH
jgi:hypothetical protein